MFGILEMDSKIKNLVVGISLPVTRTEFCKWACIETFRCSGGRTLLLSGRLKKVHHFLLAWNKNNNKCSDKLAWHLNVISRQLPGAAALSLGQKHRNDERDGDDDTRAATESLVCPPLPAACQREPDALTGLGKLFRLQPRNRRYYAITCLFPRKAVGWLSAFLCLELMRSHQSRRHEH